MKYRFFAAVLMLFIMGCAVSSRADDQEKALVYQRQTERPVYNEGDSWRFRYTRKEERIGAYRSAVLPSGEYEVLYIGDSRFKVFSLTNGKKEEVTVARGALFNLFEPRPNNDRPLLRFPLGVGDSWEFQYVHDRTRTWTTTSIKVLGVENIKTEAGTFIASKMERRSNGTSIGRRPGRVFPWHDVYHAFYSSDTKCIVKLTPAEVESWRDVSVSIGIELIGYGQK